MRPPHGPLLTVLAVALFISGCMCGGGVGAIATFRLNDGPAIYARLPHHVPPTPDATPFRFAMVHDVIHERYPRNGPAFYRERERLARKAMAVLHPESEAALGLTDDVAVGLDRTGHTDEAVALMRDKLRRQETAGLTGKELYSSYANLGEFLVRGNLWAMLDGDATARERVLEGRAFLRKSVEVNPKAHFGREEWQLIAVDALLEAGSDPSVLLRCDLIGNRLDITIEVPRESWGVAPFDDTEAVFGRPYTRFYGESIRPGRPVPDYSHAVVDQNEREQIRQYIYAVGGETPPLGTGGPKRGRRAPFDEPSMWLIGEWRQGGGPSPHLALCLGEIMLRVGQRYLAWNCYERASRLADQFSPKAELKQFLRDHCRARQAHIEKSLKPEEVAALRPKFETELAFGEAYQREYQEYTERKVAAGANLNDPQFFDEFHTGRDPIASRVGPEEWYAASRKVFGQPWMGRAFLVWGLLAGGACLLLLALFQRRWFQSRRARRTEVTPPL